MRMPNMFNFKKSKYPNFRILKNFHKRNFYFLRNAEWSWVDQENILVTNPGTLDIVTLTGWPQLIFTSATGEKTIEEFVHFIAGKYADNIPDTLDQVIIFQLLELESKKLLVLTNKKQMLPNEFEMTGLTGTE